MTYFIACDTCRSRTDNFRKKSVAFDIWNARERTDAVEAVDWQWIPVKERLPDQNTEFIIVANCETTHTPRIVRRKALVEVEHWGVTVGYYAHNAKVTHWMPLPKVPEEETE